MKEENTEREESFLIVDYAILRSIKVEIVPC